MGIAFGSAINGEPFLRLRWWPEVPSWCGRSWLGRSRRPSTHTQQPPAPSGGVQAVTAARRIRRPKVTGAKVYAADFRAVDMPGWPPDTAHAMLLKAPDATHI